MRSRFALFLFLPVVLVLGLPAQEKFGDVNKTSPKNGSSLPNGFTNFQGWTWFAAGTIRNGIELHKTDGARNTSVFKDIWPGAGSSKPEDLTVVGNLMFFSAEIPTHGRSLFVTDGKPANTRPIAVSGTTGTNPRYLVALGNICYFVAGLRSGDVLCMSDGVTATQLTNGTNPARPKYLTAVGKQILFNAADSAGDEEVWNAVGKFVGRLKDLNPNGSSRPGPFVSDGTVCLFPANRGQGLELWASDGSSVGTGRVPFFGGKTATVPLEITPSGSGAFFRAFHKDTGAELWYVDRVRGAVLVKDIFPGSLGSTPRTITPDGQGGVYFIANTLNGTRILHSSGPNTQSVFNVTDFKVLFSASEMKVMNGQLYLAGSEPLSNNKHGFELFKLVKGNPATVQPVFDLVDKNGNKKAGVAPAELLIDSTRKLLIYRGNDGVHGVELWSSDGNSASMIADLDYSKIKTTLSSLPAEFTELGDSVVFSAEEPVTGRELWIVKKQGVNPAVLDIEPGSGSSFPQKLHRVGGRVVFVAGLNRTSGFYTTDGTRSGTTRISTVAGPSRVRDIASTGPWAAVVVNKRELWVTDGRTISSLVTFPTFRSGEIKHLTAAGNHVFFVVDDGKGRGIELWVTDGTAKGTALFADIHTGRGGSNPRALTEYCGRLAFVASNGFREDIYLTGDIIGKVAKLTGGVTSPLKFGPTPELAAGRETLYFVADDGRGLEPWLFDKTGARILADVNKGAGGSNPKSLTPVGEYVFFTATTPANGTELWSSKGTPSTTLISEPQQKDKRQSSIIKYMTAVGSEYLYYVTKDPTYGFEIFEHATGTTSGSRVTRIGTLTSPGEIEHMVLCSRMLVFAAKDPWLGIEPWKLRLGHLAHARRVAEGCTVGYQATGLSVDAPVIGKKFWVVIKSPLSQAGGLLALSGPVTPIGLSKDCHVWVDGNTVILPFQMTGGIHSQQFQIPNDKNLIGKFAYFQAALSNNASQIGMDISNVVEANVGR